MGVPGLHELPAASALLSGRWSRDSVLTSHPARLYSGAVIERIDGERLPQLVEELRGRNPAIRVKGARLGVYTWDVAGEDDAGPFVLQVPVALDGPGQRGRAKRDVPRRNAENMRFFADRGLARYVLSPRELVTLGGGISAALLDAAPAHHPLAFGRGALHVELVESDRSWLCELGVAATAELLAEIVAAIVYHYDPEEAGGTALTDVFVNDGDFLVRRSDGGFELRLGAARFREPGVSPSLLLLYLIQMLAYEDWTVGDALSGLPTLMSNPSVAFHGAVRGLRYRWRDLGRSDDDGAREARHWIADFGRSREGRAYRPWVERFLAGELPLAFGADPRERWWRFIPLQSRLGVLELRARQDPGGPAVGEARAFRALLDRLSREVGRLPAEDPQLARVNDLDRGGLDGLLAEAGLDAAARDAVTSELLAAWPFRSLDHVVATVPSARPLRRVRSRLSFGRVLGDAEQATLASLGPAPQEDGPTRPIANPEIHGGLEIPASLHAEALQAFPSFEAYMDAALHDARWGYYAHRVSIGAAGHFNTNPEDFSPHYGRWIARAAFRCWRTLVKAGDVAESDPFPIVEFGAGNGRLARDVLDALVASAGQRERAFAARVEYRIYETSASLRDKQRALLGDRAVVAAGDARRPAETLGREFPGGLRGLVVTNEVPDAFGVHKILLAAEGDTFTALVVPRVEAGVRESLDRELSRRITDVDAVLRNRFALTRWRDDLYLDARAFAATMEALAGLPAAEREAGLAALWFEEAYVPANLVPELAAHLTANADAYAAALAAEPSGVILYVNVHADRFIRELGASLAAGFVVTIDYGDTTQGLVRGARRGDFPFRVYGEPLADQPRPNDPYAFPGTQDLTADVNFTALARAGRAAGLEVVHYGPERDLVGEELPAVLRQAEDDPAVAEFLGNPVFKVLVLGTRPSGAFRGPLIVPLSLEAEREVPKSRRARVAEIANRIAAGPGQSPSSGSSAAR